MPKPQLRQTHLAAEVCLQSRQETAAAVDYRKRAKALKAGISFLEQPIPDQEVLEGLNFCGVSPET